MKRIFQRLKKLKLIAVTAVLALLLLAGCAQGSTADDLSESVQTRPNATSAQTGLYIQGQCVVDRSGEKVQGLHINDDGDIVNSADRVIVTAQNARQYTYFSSVSISENPEVEKRVSARTSDDGYLQIDPTPFEIELSAKPADATNTEISAEVTNPSVVSLVDSKSGMYVPSSDIELNLNHDGCLYLTALSEGCCEIVIHNGNNDELFRIAVEIDPEFYVSSENTEESEESGDATCAHEFQDTVIEPQANAFGYTEHICGKCGYAYREKYVKPTECKHVYKEISVPATYTADGYKVFICEDCGYSYVGDVIEHLVCEHEKTQDTVIKPTCTEKGYTLHRCKICNAYSYKDTYTDPVGHSKILDWQTTLRATCADDGEKVGRCRRCHEIIETVVIPATGRHQMCTKTVRPTETEEGYIEHYCSVCGYNYKDHFKKPEK